jgi:uncharacterized protein YqhQ
MFLSILISILISCLVVWFVPGVTKIRWLWIIVKILLFPFILAIGYEFIRLAGKHLNNPVTKIISAPGLWMQRITTKEPTDDIIEVGIQAIKAALGLPYDPVSPVPIPETTETPAPNEEAQDE